MKRVPQKNLTIRKRYAKENDVTLFHGDCLKLLEQIPDNSAQLVITSPPYNLGKSYEKKGTLESYIALQRLVIAEAVRITRDGGSICWQVGHHINGHRQVFPLDLLLHPIFQDYSASAEVYLRNRIIWHYEHGLHCKHRFSGRHETILWYTKGKEYVFNLDDVRVPQKYPGKRGYRGANRGKYTGNPLGKNPGDVWIFPNVKSNHIEKTEHPCQFPVELPDRLIRALTKPRDLVVDPFLGSGTTAVAAVLNRRRVAGADLLPEYIDVSRHRIMQASRGQLRYRLSHTPIYVLAANTPLRKVPEEFAQLRLLYANGGSSDGAR
jgi:adenine-specific DNA-methyltransferase